MGWEMLGTLDGLFNGGVEAGHHGAVVCPHKCPVQYGTETEVWLWLNPSSPGC